jgi:hypothetical protein
MVDLKGELKTLVLALEEQHIDKEFRVKVDMSPEAIDARLTLTSELLNLCLSLGEAKPVSLKNSEEQKDSKEKPSLQIINEPTN